MQTPEFGGVVGVGSRGGGPQQISTRAVPLGVRARALLVGAALIPLVVGVSQWLEVAGNYPGMAQGPYPSNYLVPFPALCALLALMGANWLWRRVRGEAWLRAQELLAVYVMMTVAITAGSSMFGAGILEVVGVAHKAQVLQGAPAPSFETLGPLLPKRLVVSDAAILVPLYSGGGWPSWRLVAAELGPLVAMWAGFMVLLGLLLYGTAVLFSKQWIHHERLSYPVVQLPQQVVQQGQALWRSRLLWIGLAIPVALHAVNGATRLMPSVPPLKIVLYANELTAQRPWNSAWPIIFALNLSAIGIGFFTPTEVLFSAWFFVWASKAALVAANALGFGEPNIYQGAPYITEHSYGSYLALAVYTLWLGRLHLRGVVRAMKVGSLDSVGVGLVLLIGAGAALAALFAHYVIGLAGWVAAVFMVLFLAFSAGLARLRAQAAPPDPGLTVGQADALMKVALGPRVLGHKSIVGLSMPINSFTYWGQRNPIAAMTDALRLRGEGVSGWRWVVPLALAVAVPSGLVITLALYFRHGLALRAFYWQGAVGEWLMADAVSRVTSIERWHPGPLMGVGSGFMITALVAAMRARFPSFPLHPIGVAVCAGYGMHHMWFSVFLVWAIKASLVRWGGLRAWRGAIPFFVGLIAGEALMQAEWSGLNAALGRKFYTCTE